MWVVVVVECLHMECSSSSFLFSKPFLCFNAISIPRATVGGVLWSHPVVLFFPSTCDPLDGFLLFLIHKCVYERITLRLFALPIFPREMTSCKKGCGAGFGGRRLEDFDTICTQSSHFEHHSDAIFDLITSLFHDMNVEAGS